MDINKQIAYNWTLGCNGMSPPPKPIVNSLLKAMIEKNVDEMEKLFYKGASLEKTDEGTLKRVLYHVLDNYDVIACLVKHGFASFNGAFLKKSSYRAVDECVNPNGYICGLPGRAWYLKAYDVVRLLVNNGFGGMSFWANGQRYDAEEFCFQNNDVETIKIFLENGEEISHYSLLCKKYTNSKVTEYLENIPIIKRKSVLLSPYLFRVIPELELDKVGLFGRKSAKEKNARILAHYEDLIAGQKKFIEKIGQDRWRKQIEEEEMSSRALVEIARKIRKNYETNK